MTHVVEFLTTLLVVLGLGRLFLSNGLLMGAVLICGLLGYLVSHLL
jgi:hypothetical protein